MENIGRMFGNGNNQSNKENTENKTDKDGKPCPACTDFKSWFKMKNKEVTEKQVNKLYMIFNNLVKTVRNIVYLTDI